MSGKRALVLLVLLFFAHTSQPEDVAGDLAVAAGHLAQVSQEGLINRKRLGEIFGDRQYPEGQDRIGMTKNGVEQFSFRSPDGHIYSVRIQNGETLASASYHQFIYRTRGVRLETLHQELVDELSQFFQAVPVYDKRNDAIWKQQIYDGSTRDVRFHISKTPVVGFGFLFGFPLPFSLSRKNESIAISLRIDYKIIPGELL